MSTSDQSMLQTLALREETRDEYLVRRDPIATDRLRWRAQSFRHSGASLARAKYSRAWMRQGLFTRQLVHVTHGRNPITAVTFGSCSQWQSDWSGIGWSRCPRNSFPGTLRRSAIRLYRRDGFARSTKLRGHASTGPRALETGRPGVVLRKQPVEYRAQASSGTRIAVRQIRSSRRFSAAANCTNSCRKWALSGSLLCSTILSLRRLSPRLIWLFRNLSIILENAPGIRTLAGSILVHAQKPPRVVERPAVSLAMHKELRRAISVVVPCYNEEMNVEPLVAGLRRHYDDYLYEIILVDDNSKDGTADVIRSMAATDDRIRLVSRTGPNGVGRALSDGYRAATGQYVLTMDCDFQHLLPEISDLFDAAVKGYDVVVGSRFSRHSVLLNYPFGKIVANRGFHLIAQILLLRRFRDLTNNLKLLRREVVDQLHLLEPWFAVNAETGLQPLLMGYQVKEVPISWINRTPDMGMSSFKLAQVGWGYWRVLGRLWLRAVFGVGAYQGVIGTGRSAAYLASHRCRTASAAG